MSSGKKLSRNGIYCAFHGASRQSAGTSRSFHRFALGLIYNAPLAFAQAGAKSSAASGYRLTSIPHKQRSLIMPRSAKFNAIALGLVAGAGVGVAIAGALAEPEDKDKAKLEEKKSDCE